MNLRKLPALPLWLVPSSRARIAVTYRYRHGRWPDLANPTRFTELVQRRKLEDRDPRIPALSDKVAAKSAVAAKLGDDWTIPTYWEGSSLPAEPAWPYPFILKSRHGSDQSAVCHDGGDWARARRRALGWTRRPYGLWLDEWGYRGVPRGYIVEPYLGEGDTLPLDYKIYVFAGRAAFVQVHQDRAGHHRWVLFDTAWQQRSMLGLAPVAPPESLPQMLRAAERLAAGFSFARVDFYQIGAAPKFGEVTFYPGSGLDPFDPDTLDCELGALWLEALALHPFEKSEGGGVEAFWGIAPVALD